MVTPIDRRPFFVLVPICAVLFALESTALQLGLAGIGGGLVVGAAWSVGLGALVAGLERHERWTVITANAPVFAGTMITGVLIGAGTMYGFLMSAALDAPAPVLSAMMKPTVPYFIVLNTLMEWVVVPALLYANWHQPRRRSWLMIGSAVYLVMRAWTYSTYASTRLEIAGRPLSAEDIEWFRRTLRVDYRNLLNVVTHLCFATAAFVPAKGRPT